MDHHKGHNRSGVKLTVRDRHRLERARVIRTRADLPPADRRRYRCIGKFSRSFAQSQLPLVALALHFLRCCVAITMKRVCQCKIVASGGKWRYLYDIDLRGF